MVGLLDRLQGVEDRLEGVRQKRRQLATELDKARAASGGGRIISHLQDVEHGEHIRELINALRKLGEEEAELAGQLGERERERARQEAVALQESLADLEALDGHALALEVASIEKQVKAIADNELRALAAIGREYNAAKRQAIMAEVTAMRGERARLTARRERAGQLMQALRLQQARERAALANPGAPTSVALRDELASMDQEVARLEEERRATAAIWAGVEDALSRWNPATIEAAPAVSDLADRRRTRDSAAQALSTCDQAIGRLQAERADVLRAIGEAQKQEAQRKVEPLLAQLGGSLATLDSILVDVGKLVPLSGQMLVLRQVANRVRAGLPVVQ